MKIEPIRPFFCHKVLPLEYDESLSYYEILCKLVHSLNLTIENVNQLGADFKALYNWVNNYFDNLDVQEEIDNKLDELIESGEFGRYLISILGYVTPTMYGAKGDGETDDTQAFIDCYADANTKGLNVKIFQGTYKIPGIVEQPSVLEPATVISAINSVDTRTECSPDCVLDLRGLLGGSTAINLYNSDWLGGTIYNDNTGFVLQSGDNRVEKAKVIVSSGNGISCQQGTGVIEDCEVENTDSAVMGIWSDYNNGVNNQYVLQIHNCYIHGFRKNGIFTSAKCCDIAYNLLDGNHIDTEPYGGGQIDVVGKQTQGYTTVRNNIIQNGGSNVTSGIELDWSGSAEIFGNIINVANTMLYGIVLQDASNASVHDNTIIGGHNGEPQGTAIGCTGDNTKKNILRTHNNWLFNCANNVYIANVSSIVSVDEQRYEGDLFTFGSLGACVVDVNNQYVLDTTLNENESCKLYFKGVHNLRFVVSRTVPVENQPTNYSTDVTIDAINAILATSSQSPDFSIVYDDTEGVNCWYVQYTNATLEQPVNVRVLVVN